MPVYPGAQWVLTLPFPLRFALAFDGRLLGAVLRIFTDTVATWYVYVRDANNADAPPVFHPAPAPTQDDVQFVVKRAAKRIVRFLQKRGLIALATAPGDGEVTVVVGDETLGNSRRS